MHSFAMRLMHAPSLEAHAPSRRGFLIAMVGTGSCLDTPGSALAAVELPFAAEHTKAGW